MAEQILDGTGSGKLVGVTDSNRLKVDSASDSPPTENNNPAWDFADCHTIQRMHQGTPETRRGIECSRGS